MVISTFQLVAIFAVPALILKYRDNKLTRLFGTIGMAYFYGILAAVAIYVLNLTGVDFALNCDIGEIGSYAAIGVAIPLLLFGSNLKEVRKLTRTVLLSFGSLVLSVILVAVAMSCLFGSGFPWGKELCAMATGLYTGGTPNFNAIGVILKVDSSVIAVGNLADMMIGGVFYVFILLLAKPLLSKILRNPSQITYLKAGKGATNVDVLQNGTWNRGIVRNVLLSLAIVVAGVGAGALLWLARGAQEGTLVDHLVPGIMVTATLLGIAFSFCKKVREVRENTLVGQYLILVFSFALASSLDLARLSADFQKILFLLSAITLISFLVHVAFSKLLGIDADCTIVTMTAGIYGPAFIPAVTSQIGNDKLTAPGLICGALGYVIGTLLGVTLHCIL